MSVNNPTPPTLEEWATAGDTGHADVWTLVRRQVAYLRSRPKETPVLTDEMIDAVREVRSAYGYDMLKPWSFRMAGAMGRFNNAFAFVLNPPASPKEKTVRGKIEANSKLDSTFGGKAFGILADAIDALTARLDKVDKEKP